MFGFYSEITILDLTGMQIRKASNLLKEKKGQKGKSNTWNKIVAVLAQPSRQFVGPAVVMLIVASTKSIG